MKDFEYYSTNDMKYPDKADFTVTKLYVKTEICSGYNNIREYFDMPSSYTSFDVKNNIPDKDKFIIETVFDKEGYTEYTNKYMSCLNEKEAQFKADLLEEAGITDHPKADMLFNKAWEQGHSSGYSEVYNCFYDLLDLIQ